MGFSARFRWYHPTESNSIVYLFNFSELKNSNKTHFQNSKCMNKNFEKVFYLPIIIDNTFHIIYGIRTLFTISFFYLIGPYLRYQHINLRLAYYFTLFFFSCLWTNSAYFYIQDLNIQHISLSRANFILFRYFDSKKVRYQKLEKQILGCAIHMKEYTIMMYLANQIPRSNNEPF